MRKIIFFILLVVTIPIFAQTPVTFTVSPTVSGINSSLAGSNIAITGGVINFGNSTQIATFTQGLGANLQMDKGVYFSTGSASTDLSQKNTYIATTNSPAGGVTYSDIDLVNIDANAIHDVISYEFNITLANTVSGVNIAYQFGSEEYPDFAGSTYNDTFGFFISGPGLSGNVNLAKLPNGKDTNVNTINAGIRGNLAEFYPNSAFDPSQASNYINNGHTTQTYVNNGITYYYDNPEPQPGPRVVYTEHNGISKLINYSIRNLIPGSTYTFKIIIADSSDEQRDSGVYIKDISAFADLNAADDSYTVNQGYNVTSSILNNDTSNGTAVTSSLVSISSSNLPAGFSIDSEGKIIIQNTVSPGIYQFNYTICDKSNPIYCKSAAVTVTVAAPTIDAVNGTQSVSSGTTGTTSVLANDTYNGGAAGSATLANVNLTQTATTNAGVTLNTTTGMITVAAGTPAGTYVVTYKICDKINPGVCDTATETVNVAATYCYKLPVVTAGTAVPSNHGITALGRAGADNSNWPMVRQSAWTVLEAKTKGFVVNRVANPTTDIANPVEGMMVFDTTAQCLKIYNGKVWSCYSRPACP